MRIQLLLPSVPVFSIRNVVLAAWSFCSHFRNVFTGSIVNPVFFKKTPFFINAGSVFSFSPAWQYRSQKFARAVIISIDNVVKLNI
ncbi:hypothetical protein [Terrimonas pollutisoli]|uniref:hypothetical protein n=1 Tax=Terrimonas pollutisoli TaxID=3034147 RepID=UPI0023EB39CA|nr:hypothetical protein [Terrimonas sp. H1YJ31]